jgi:hypothetical protein
MQQALDAIARSPTHVRLNMARLEQVAAIMPDSIASNWYALYRNTEERYQHTLPPLPDMHLSDLDLIQWTVVASSQGFLFWQREPDGSVVPHTIHVDGQRYVGGIGVEMCNARAIRQGRNILDPHYLVSMTMADLEDHYRDDITGEVTLQLLDKRLDQFHAVGRVLIDEYDGHFVNVLRQADGYLYREDGQGFIQLLLTRFAGAFSDWPLCKRPNVDALGLYMKRSNRTLPPELDRICNFKDIDKLIIGPDYYRPLWFVRTGIFEISDELKQKLRNRELIEPGSEMEQEYRALTIIACLELAERIGGWPDAAAPAALETHGHPFLRCRRCRIGISDEELPCPYRPVCRAAQGDQELMECGWPLVLTTAY